DGSAVAQQPAESMRRFEGRNDAFCLAEAMKGFQRQRVTAIVIFDTPGSLQVGVLRPDGWVIESSGNRVRLGDLSEFVLQNHRSLAVQDAERPAAESRRMLAQLWPAA